MKFKYLYTIFAITATVAACGLKDGEHRLEVLTTNDVHGSWFDSTYMGNGVKPSLFAANHYIDSIRSVVGRDNVILIDAGDCLQGDNAAYYFNYVDTLSPHLFPRIVSYMKYDAVTVGNHDIETGHKVYDRVCKELKDKGIPFLAGNAIRTDNNKTYFPLCRIFRKSGLKVAVLGYTNPNIKAWLSEELWSGMSFKSLIPLVQEDVNIVRAKEKPDALIISIHSGTGAGDGKIYESQGLDLFKSLRGVDFLICSHDHAAYIAQSDSICLINSGSHARNIGHGTITINAKNGHAVSRTLSAELIPVDAHKADTAMRRMFEKDFEAVCKFTKQEVGSLKSSLFTRDAYKGMCDYMNLLHTISLTCSPAQISFAAPLTYNDEIKSGTLVYNDLFKIYPYENQVFVIKMSGNEIKRYLEFSYDKWINTISSPDEHLLKIENKGDLRYSQTGWSFANRAYNFDSAGGLNYTVDVTRPFGSRIKVTGLAGGQPFSPESTYFVAMTSYRANGGGDLLNIGAGVDADRIEDRIVRKYPEFRNLLYNYLKDTGSIDPEVTGDQKRIGTWKFIPEKIAGEALEKDLKLLFR